jgi:two-component system, NtrC family, response regulator AtoC
MSRQTLDLPVPGTAPDDQAPTVSLKADDGRGPTGSARLHIFHGESVHTFLLPPTGTVLIGRSSEAHVQINAPSVSRRHLAVHVGARIELEDLGSSNGTTLRDTRLTPGQRVEVAFGEGIDVGSVMLVIQPTASPRVAAPSEGAMRRLRRLVDRVAPSNISVLLLGETGVGKERFAERIHRRSARASRPFLGLNCAALPESLLESELFGHERGAFTGALGSKPGLFEAAHGGTLFLDEVAELPLAVQVKLLRVLDTRQVLRLGALKPRPFDVRFVAATNRDLDAEVARGTFREDLFYRLSGLVLMIPPLRERTDEIERLAGELIDQVCAGEGLAHRPPISPQALALLRGHRWPGNVRELRNVLERAVLLAGEGPVLAEHLLLDRVVVAPAPSEPPAPARQAAPATAPELLGKLKEIERQRVTDALAAVGGNQTRAAKLLGISRGTLISRVKEFALVQPRRREPGR